MTSLLKKTAIILAILGFLAFSAGSAYVYFVVLPNLPSIESIREIQLQTPLRIYSADGKLIGEFGEKKRTPLSYQETPPLMVKAILAAEDDRFFEHPGVDYQGILRAVYSLLLTGEKSQGGSTITMQVVRNFFLTREKTYLRKLNEILLSLKIERALSKEEILELYLNKVFLGHRSYGFGAAAQVYYGKSISELSLAQIAMIAGLPKAPSRYNPITNLDRATLRRNYVLRRMHELGYIDQQQFQSALDSADDAQLHTQPIGPAAPHVAEMVRAELYRQYGADAYTQGHQVYTTLDSQQQQAANQALRLAVREYDWRHGYRGPLKNVMVDGALPDPLDEVLKEAYEGNGLTPAVVTAFSDTELTAHTLAHGDLTLAWDRLSWARPVTPGSNRPGASPQKVGDIVAIGDLVLLAKNRTGQWALSQIPEIEGALVSLSPTHGAIRALVGGFDFYQSKFNRAVQGHRQPGSSFKPFIYAAALEKGYTPASLINDAPVVFEDDALETMWRPENYSGKFFGPTRIREAMIHSRNMVSIRLLRSIGIGYAVDYASRFGFSREQLPRDLSLALGSASTSPLEIATGYAVLANGGFRVAPFFIDRIEDAQGNTLFQATPEFACLDCIFSEPTDSDQPTPLQLAPQVLDPQVAYQTSSLLKDVIQQGTGRRALSLGRTDLHGKTGTTNDLYDAWFSGYNTALVTTSWIGFDQPQPLGRGESGGRAALPMWIYYMEQAIKGLPEIELPQPPGMITVRIDPETGKLASSNQRSAIFETFRAEYAPKEMAPPPAIVGSTTPNTPSPVIDQGVEELF